VAESLEREKLAREKAESANRAKDYFLASLSHELRTPLNPILLLASDGSENADFPPEIRTYFQTIRKNIELEARLIDDLLDITRITHGKLSLHLNVVDVKMVLEEAIRYVRPELDEKLIDLQFHFVSPSRHFQGDDARLHQVFWNVLKNAVKFTPPRGTITISAQLVENYLRISVTDTGIGINPAELGQIFDAFSQGDPAKNVGHRFGGLGLGLAIARKLVEMHNGRIAATSEGPGKGATFTIELPAVKPAKSSLPILASSLETSSPRAIKPAICVLLVEDHEPTRMALSHLLSRRGFKVVSVSNAAEARNAVTKEKIGLVISDIGLPAENGNELMKHLSISFGLKGIALTGYGMEEDIEKCRVSGFGAHLVKPVNIHALENALALVLNH